MKLTELNPIWLNTRTRLGIGMRFTCNVCGCQIAVLFLNPMDGKPPLPNDAKTDFNNDGCRWARSGLNFDELTLSPSINATSTCKPECKPECTPEKHACANHPHGHWQILHGEISCC